MTGCFFKKKYIYISLQRHTNLLSLPLDAQALVYDPPCDLFSLTTKQTLIDSENDMELKGGKKPSPAA